MTEAVYPAWPRPTFDTRDEAIAAAVAQSVPGDTVEVHEDDCQEPCSCAPTVFVVEEGKA